MTLFSSLRVLSILWNLPHRFLHHLKTWSCVKLKISIRNEWHIASPRFWTRHWHPIHKIHSVCRTTNKSRIDLDDVITAFKKNSPREICFLINFHIHACRCVHIWSPLRETLGMNHVKTRVPQNAKERTRTMNDKPLEQGAYSARSWHSNTRARRCRARIVEGASFGRRRRLHPIHARLQIIGSSRGSSAPEVLPATRHN